MTFIQFFAVPLLLVIGIFALGAAIKILRQYERAVTLPRRIVWFVGVLVSTARSVHQRPDAKTRR